MLLHSGGHQTSISDYTAIVLEIHDDISESDRTIDGEQSSREL